MEINNVHIANWFLVSIAVSFLSMTTHASETPSQSQITVPEEIIQNALEYLCSQKKLPFPVIENSGIEARGRVIGQRTTYHINKTGQLQVERLGTTTKIHSYRLTYTKDTNHPVIFIATDQTCSIRVARRISYNDQAPLALQLLDTDLKTVTREEVIRPAVPEGEDPGGIRVGIIDSGVNYLLPEISQKLARNPDGSIVGYDFWDLDDLPYDYNPARSVFFPQRHGTRTAGLLLIEAPDASLVPYRYPRPDMSRMADLIDHAAKHDVKIIAMPLGSKDKNEWLDFFRSAENHPEILFIISSGNNGVNIDDYPVYPASFNLDNILVVSSADEIPSPASRTNWGKKSVDILLPADRQNSIDFDGEQKMVSGTSYAVSRIAALAARIKQRQPKWSTNKVKDSILKMADNKLAKEHATYGLLFDPLIDTATVKIINQYDSRISDQHNTDSPTLNVTVAVLQNSGWTMAQAKKSALQAREIYLSCNINLQITLRLIEVNDYLQDFHSLTSRTLIEKTNFTTPTIFLVRDTRRLEAFGGEAFGENNSKKLPWLKNTAWLIAEQKDPGITMAHELFHIFVDNGDHSSEAGNLMNSETESHNTQLNAAQCEDIKESKLLQY
jgi:hypothetical protein